MSKIKKRIERYNKKHKSFINDLINFGIKKDFNIYFDLMQYIYHCDFTYRGYNIPTIINSFNCYAMASGFGYNMDTSIYRPHVQVMENHIKTLASFFKLYVYHAPSKTNILNLTPPPQCWTHVKFFGHCGVLVDCEYVVCERCDKYRPYGDKRHILRFNEMLSELTQRDTLIERSPEIFLLTKI